MKLEIQIDGKFQREQFLEGVELNDSYTAEVDIAELSLEQRQFLLDRFDSRSTNIEHSLIATMPRLEPSDKIIYINSFWQAKINPHDSQIIEVLEAWIADFNAELERLQRAGGTLEK